MNFHLFSEHKQHKLMQIQIQHQIQLQLNHRKQMVTLMLHISEENDVAPIIHHNTKHH